MDPYILIMGAALAAAGWFLSRDYVNAVRSAFSLRGKVVSVQPAYVYSPDSPIGRELSYFPVIEYESQREKVRFTSIDPAFAGLYQVGDPVSIRVLLNRRQKARISNSLAILAASLSVMIGALLFGGLRHDEAIGLSHICIASAILALSLSVLCGYFRQQDLAMDDQGSPRGWIVMPSPTSFAGWMRAAPGEAGERRLWPYQMAGLGCVAAGVALVVMSIFLIKQTAAIAMLPSTLSVLGL